MADLSLTHITIPTPEPYNKSKSDQQRENLAYVALQVLQEAKQDGFTLSDGLVTAIESLTLAGSGGEVDLSGIEQALRDLRFNSMVVDFGPFRLEFDGRTWTLGEE